MTTAPSTKTGLFLLVAQALLPVLRWHLLRRGLLVL